MVFKMQFYVFDLNESAKVGLTVNLSPAFSGGS